MRTRALLQYASLATAEPGVVVSSSIFRQSAKHLRLIILTFKQQTYSFRVSLTRV